MQINYLYGVIAINCIRYLLERFSLWRDSVISLAVLPFSKLNKIIFGYFDPENIFLDNKNKYFSA